MKSTSINNCTLICGDCLEVMEDLVQKGTKVDLVDLPYGTTASNWDKLLPMKTLWNYYHKLLTPTGTAVLFANFVLER